jgi:toxin-antitoxin system PIN domain toxin
VKTVALLDVNVLLALAWPNHQHHRAAHAWFHREAGRGWATCALTQLGFIRLSSNPAYTSAPATPREAATLLGQLTAHTAHHYWAALAEPASFGFALALGHQQVMDAYLVSVAERHHGRLVTFDRRISGHAKTPSAVQVIEG